MRRQKSHFQKLDHLSLFFKAQLLGELDIKANYQVSSTTVAISGHTFTLDDTFGLRADDLIESHLDDLSIQLGLRYKWLITIDIVLESIASIKDMEAS